MSDDNDNNQLQEFRCFPRLPPEIQLMIFEAYRDLRPRIRHCYLSRHPRNRCYTAVDTNTGCYVDVASWATNSSPRDTPIHPAMGTEDNKVALPGRNYLNPSQGSVARTEGLAHLVYYSGISRRYFQELGPGPLITWVNYERDVIWVSDHCFTNHPSNMPVNRLGMVRTTWPVGNQQTRLGRNHWIMGVQKLAISLESFRNNEPNVISDFDQQILSQLPHLRRLYLVIAKKFVCPAGELGWDEHPNEDAFVAYEDYLRCHHKIGGLEDCRCVEGRKHVEDAKELLVPMFERLGRTVQVEIVADTY